MPRKAKGYDSTSLDATLATIISEVKQTRDQVVQQAVAQSTVLADIHSEVRKTNGRVTQLETWRASVRGRMLGVVAACGVVGTVIGWVFQWWAGRK